MAPVSDFVNVGMALPGTGLAKLGESAADAAVRRAPDAAVRAGEKGTIHHDPTFRDKAAYVAQEAIISIAPGGSTAKVIHGDADSSTKIRAAGEVARVGAFGAGTVGATQTSSALGGVARAAGAVTGVEAMGAAAVGAAIVMPSPNPRGAYGDVPYNAPTTDMLHHPQMAPLTSRHPGAMAKIAEGGDALERARADPTAKQQGYKAIADGLSPHQPAPLAPDDVDHMMQTVKDIRRERAAQPPQPAAPPAAPPPSPPQPSPPSVTPPAPAEPPSGFSVPGYKASPRDVGRVRNCMRARFSQQHGDPHTDVLPAGQAPPRGSSCEPLPDNKRQACVRADALRGRDLHRDVVKPCLAAPTM